MYLYSTTVTGGRYPVLGDLRWSFLALIQRAEVMVNREKAAWSIPFIKYQSYSTRRSEALSHYRLKT
jgi:hypothetical protein